MDLVKTKEIANALGTTKNTVLEKARRGGWAYVEKGSTFCFVENKLPADVRFALVAYRTGSVSTVSVKQLESTEKKDNLAGNAFINASEKSQLTAQYRAALLSEYRSSGLKVADFLYAYNEVRTFPVLFDKIGEVSQPTFYRWVKAFKENSASGVTPKYGQNRGGAGESLLPEERDLLKLFWLHKNQPTAMHSFRLMKENLPYSTCTYQTALRFLNDIPRHIVAFYRKGKNVFETDFLPHLEKNYLQYKSLDIVVSDHHCLDCVVKYNGELIRPWITTFQDLRSGKVLGYCPSVKPSSLSIVVAYYMCCIRYGIPRGLLFDNGKDYRSKWLNGKSENVLLKTPEGINQEQEVEFQGLFSVIGSEVRFTKVYNGRSKARQERYFRILGEYFAKSMSGFVGSDTASRPHDMELMYRPLNGMAKRNDIETWDDFVEACGPIIEYINDTFESNGVGMEGKTRSQVFAENMPSEIRHADKETLQKALMKGEIRKVKKEGVQLSKRSYWHPEIIAFIGHPVKVYRNLGSDETVTVHTINGEYICEAYADCFLETGNLSEDIAKMEHVKKRITLTAMAYLGTNENTISIESKTMLQVAQNRYKDFGNGNVDSFLDDNKEEKLISIAPQKEVANKKSNLLRPFDSDAEGYKEAVQ